MNNTFDNKRFHPFFILPFVIGLFGLLQTAQATILEAKTDLLQFNSAGHVLGFEPSGIHVASGDHLLSVKFKAARAVQPMADMPVTNKVGTAAMQWVQYSGLWEGVDLRYDSVVDGIIESTWKIAPGADPEKIQLQYNAPLEINTDGSLKIHYSSGWMQESAPVAWQEIDGQYRSVKVAFRNTGPADSQHAVIGFDIEQYDPNHVLWIDPVLQWHSFMGSAGADSAWGIFLDNVGAVYVTGRSDATWGTPVRAHSGGQDAFVAKLSSTGGLIWNTFLGGNEAGLSPGTIVSSNVTGNDLVVDINFVYVGGRSNTNWGDALILTPHLNVGYNDAFITKLNRQTGAMEWNTFFGSLHEDYLNAITMDTTGDLIVAGSSVYTWGLPVNGIANNNDAFVAKFTNAGVRTWNTFLGSSNTLDITEANAVVTDPDDNIYIAGTSNTRDLATTSASWGSPVNAYTSGREGFAAKLNSSGVLQWNTFMGSSKFSNVGHDQATGITLDSLGNVYVGGVSDRSWGTPLMARSFGVSDAFLLKLDNAGNRQWNTFIGASMRQIEFNYNKVAIASNSSNELYVSAYSYASWGAPISGHNGGDDAFVAKLNSAGAQQWNAFIGSGVKDRGTAIAVSGQTPTIAGYGGNWGSPVRPHAGAADTDAFAAKLSALYTVNTSVPAGGGSFSPTTKTVFSGDTVSFTANPSLGYSVASVSGCLGTWSTNPYVTAPVVANCTVTGSFTLNQYLVSASVDANGGLNVSSANVDHGTTATFIVTPNSSDYVTNSAVGGDCPSGSWSGSSYTTGAIAGVCSVSFTHSPSHHDVTPSPGAGLDPNGEISPATAQSVSHKTTTQFTVTPATDYHAVVDGTCGGSLSGMTFTTNVIVQDCTVEASFILNNFAPVITEGESVGVTMDEDSNPIAFALTLNAIDVNNDTLFWSINSNGDKGSASVSGTGLSKVISYTPYEDENGSDSFEVRVSDDELSDTIVISILINAIDDAPRLSKNPISDLNVDEDAEDTERSLKRTFWDVDSDNMMLEVHGNTNSGLVSASLVGTDLTLSYAPDQHGSADITIRASADGKMTDDTFHVTVAPINDPPVIISPEQFFFIDGQVGVGQVRATDVESDPLTFTLNGGEDQGLFSLTPGGALSFLNPPDSKVPADFDGDNKYMIVIEAFDTFDTISQTVTVMPNSSCSAIVIPVATGKSLSICL